MSQNKQLNYKERKQAASKAKPAESLVSREAFAPRASPSAVVLA